MCTCTSRQWLVNGRLFQYMNPTGAARASFFSHWIPAEYIFQAGFRVPKSRLWDSPPGEGEYM